MASLDLFVCRMGVQAKRALGQLKIIEIKIIIMIINVLFAFHEKPGQLG